MKKQYRGSSLVDRHSSASNNDAEGDDKKHLIWDHTRDMSLSGRLLDDSQRSKLVKDAKGLGDRFGTGKSGGFL